MKLCCCFCGKEVESLPGYSLIIRKDSGHGTEDAPEQQLYSHEKCLEDRLHTPDWLYLKHL